MLHKVAVIKANRGYHTFGGITARTPVRNVNIANIQ